MYLEVNTQGSEPIAVPLPLEASLPALAIMVLAPRDVIISFSLGSRNILFTVAGQLLQRPLWWGCVNAGKEKLIIHSRLESRMDAYDMFPQS